MATKPASATKTATKTPAKEPKRMDPARILEATGKSAEHWYKLLDKWGAPTKGHKAIATHLSELGVSPWWSQTVTVEYERDRGLREVHQTTRGFEATVNRTLAHDADTVWAALTEPARMNKWWSTKTKQELKVGGKYSNGDGDQGTFVTIKPGKKLTFTWDNPQYYPGSLVVFDLWPKDGGKTLLRVTQSKLPDQAAVDQQKEGWSWAMDSLKAYLETGKGIKYEDWQAGK